MRFFNTPPRALIVPLLVALAIFLGRFLFDRPRPARTIERRAVDQHLVEPPAELLEHDPREDEPDRPTDLPN